MPNGICIKGPHSLTCPSHINLELEIVYVKKGSVEVNFGKDSVLVEDGQACIVFPYCIHRFLQSEDSEAYVLMFSYDIYEELYGQFRDHVPSEYKFILSPEATVYIDSLIKQRDKLSIYEIRCLYYVCLSAFFKRNTFKKSSNNDLLKKIINVVNDDAVEKITIKSVAEQCGVSESVLSSYLKNQAKIKFRDLTKDILVSKALVLLRVRDLTITQVAIKSGFGSLRSFNRIFFEVMGCTPTQYRKKG